MNPRFKRAALPAAIATLMAPLTLAESVDDSGLEEVVVTAQKREQNLQDVPVAITAINAEDITDRKISDISDVGSTAPNVQIAPSPGGSTGATIAIRGAASINPAATWEPSVGLYMDGVFIAKNVGGIFDVAELSAIEILRGPQGTLYGKNTTGGAINLVTRKPYEEFGAKVKVGAGNYGYTEWGGTVDSGLIADKATFMLSYTKRDRDGFYDNEAPNAKIDEFKKLDTQALLFKASVDATDHLNLTYTLDFAERDNTVAFGQAEQLDQLDSVNALDEYLKNTLTADEYTQFSRTQLPNLQANAGELPSPKRLGEGALDGAGYDKSKTQGHNIITTFDINDQLTLKSITAYREMEFNDSNDYDGTAFTVFHTDRNVEQNQTSQELQLVGQYDQVAFVSGLFYFSDEVDVSNPYYDPFGGAQHFYGVKSDAYAVFGQADWLATDNLTLTVGGRFTSENKDAYTKHSDRTVWGVIPIEGYDESAEETWTNFSPMMAINYAVNEELTTYFKASQGWRSGGFNGESATKDEARTPYEEEVTTSYELGLKGRSDDNRLQYNLAVFRNLIEDMQLSNYNADTGYSVIENAGEAQITGLELEVQLAVTEGLVAKVSHGYMDAKYTDFVNPITKEQQKDTATFAYTPESKSSLALIYTHDLGFGEFKFNTDYSYTSEQVFYRQANSSKVTKSPGYALLNGRIALANIATAGAQSLDVGLWGKNLTAEAYRVNGIPYTAGTAVNYYGDPRTFGMDLTYNF